MSCPVANGQGAENGATEKDLTYVDYLQLNKLLDCVELRTAKFLPEPVHDEHLFITIHQAYEIWFKQMIFEIDSMAKILSEDPWDEKKQLLLINRIERIILIMKLVLDQLPIMETLTPLSFYSFRNYLFPASGFQSYQFRILENKFGIKPDWRIQYQKEHYSALCEPKRQKEIHEAENSPTVLTLVERWLENSSGLDKDGFDFMTKFSAQIKEFLKKEYFEKIEAAKTDEEKKERQKSYDSAKQSWDNILVPSNYEKLKKSGDAHLSHKALMGALFISHYRSEVRFHQSYQFLTKLMDLDSLMNKWRYHHVLMVQRFIGAKPGTGGSSGYHYLRSTINERYKVFVDLFNLSNYFLPNEYLPPLTEDMRRTLNPEGKIF